jgi:hypothetical protein
MSARSNRVACVLGAIIVVSGLGSDVAAQSAIPRLLRGRHLVQGYADAVDPSFTFNASSIAAASASAAMPCHLRAQVRFHALLDDLWSRSPTFRQQCRRLAGANALVVMQSASAKETPWSAESRIGVLANGRVMARMRVRDGRESVEVIAHELEHVLERIDGVNLALDSARGGSGTSLSGGAYETRRATAAGRLVAKEVGRTW